MFSPSVLLAKEGVAINVGRGAEPYRVATLGDLLHLWHWRLEAIDPEFTLGDLACLLRSLGAPHGLSCLLNAPVQEILEYASGALPVAECPMRHLEVHNVAGPTRYQPDPRNPDVPIRIIGDDGSTLIDEEEIHAAYGTGYRGTLIAVSDPDLATGEVAMGRVIAPERNGWWGGPYHIFRMFRGWGVHEAAPGPGATEGAEPEEGAYSLFFSVLPEIAHLPLRYNPELTFSAGDREGEPLRQQVAITLGEFLYAIFWGLGFNGDPESRLAMRAAVRARYGEFTVDEDGVAIPWAGTLP